MASVCGVCGFAALAPGNCTKTVMGPRCMAVVKTALYTAGVKAGWKRCLLELYVTHQLRSSEETFDSTSRSCVMALLIESCGVIGLLAVPVQRQQSPNVSGEVQRWTGYTGWNNVPCTIVGLSVIRRATHVMCLNHLHPHSRP